VLDQGVSKIPRPSLEWVITELCNYKCPYCCSEGRYGHCSDDTIKAVYRLLYQLEGSWLIKLIGGEPMIHPRFFEICEKVVGLGHKLCMTTNLSLPLEKLARFIEICGDRLDYVTASMHLSQIGIDEFVEKAIAFDSIKDPKTNFAVNSVVMEDNFEQLRAIEERLANRNVDFKYQIMKIRGKYTKYSENIENYISEKLISNTGKLRGKRLFGTYCHAGELFFRIEVNGDAVRCYSRQPHFYLGNVNGTFRRYTEASPCLARRCTCTVPANRNMIRFGEKATASAITKMYLTGLLKNLCQIGRIHGFSRISQYLKTGSRNLRRNNREGSRHEAD